MKDAHEGCKEYPGGPATFAYTGVRIWTDSVMQLSRTGKDYEPFFREWIEKNEVETQGIKIVCDRANHLYGFSHAYGFCPAPEFDAMTLDAWQDFGYQKIRPEDIGEFTKEGGVKGVYLAANPDSVFLDSLGLYLIFLDPLPEKGLVIFSCAAELHNTVCPDPYTGIGKGSRAPRILPAALVGILHPLAVQNQLPRDQTARMGLVPSVI